MKMIFVAMNALLIVHNVYSMLVMNPLLDYAEIEIQQDLAWRINSILEERPSIVHECNKYGETLLFKAAFWGRENICKTLLARGANPKKGTNFKVTPLHVARKNSVMQLLLDAGAEINAKNLGGVTPLMKAMVYIESDKVSFLLSRGASIDEQMLQEFEKQSTAESYCKEQIITIVLPFLLRNNVGECVEQKEEQKAGAGENKKECLVCYTEFNNNDDKIKFIPCYNKESKLKHTQDFLCIDCREKIRAKDNTCPLCRDVLQ